MSREQLAGLVGVRAAEMEEYDAGQSRVPADLLMHIAEAMGVPISYFFADLSPRRVSRRKLFGVGQLVECRKRPLNELRR